VNAQWLEAMQIFISISKSQFQMPKFHQTYEYENAIRAYGRTLGLKACALFNSTLQVL